MSLLSVLPRSTFKRLENLLALASPCLAPVKRLTRGYAPQPFAVVAHLTYRCNFDCVMCCQQIPRLRSGLPSLASPAGAGAAELDTATWAGLLARLATAFPVRPFLHFSGGEPFLHTGLVELVRRAGTIGFSTSLITNGWALQSAAAELVKGGVDRIHVSLDGTEGIHDAVRGRPGSFRQAVSGIRAIREARRRAGTSRPHVTINATITPDNVGTLRQMGTVLRDSGADALTVEHLIFDDADRALADRIDPAELSRELKELEASCPSAAVYPRIPRRALAGYYRGPADDLRKGCGMLWTAMRIHPNGDAGTCRGIVAGNLAAGLGFREAWNSPRLRAARREIAALGNGPDCGRCEHRIY